MIFEKLYYVAPLLLHGEGNYALTSVKEIKVTDDFLGLDIQTKSCQIIETFEECTTRNYMKKVLEDCNCIPYNVWNATTDQVSNIVEEYLKEDAFSCKKS